MAWYVFKDLSQLRGSGAFWNVGEVGGGLISHSAMRVPRLKFPKMPSALFVGTSKPLQSSQCQVCLQSICDNATVGSCCSCPASWCFLGSSWAIWGHTIFHFDVADAAGNVAYDIVDTNMWGGGGGDCAPGNFCFRGLRPPAQDTYL